MDGKVATASSRSLPLVERLSYFHETILFTLNPCVNEFLDPRTWNERIQVEQEK